MSYGKWQPFHLGLNMLIRLCGLQKYSSSVASNAIINSNSILLHICISIQSVDCLRTSIGKLHVCSKAIQRKICVFLICDPFLFWFLTILLSYHCDVTMSFIFAYSNSPYSPFSGVSFKPQIYFIWKKNMKMIQKLQISRE